MNNKLKKVFCLTESGIKQDEGQLKRIRKKLLEDKNKKIILIKKDGNLFCAYPFTSFVGDCENCSNYCDTNRGFITGGYCTLHNIPCGYGFICKDNDSKDNIGWKEFEKIQKKVI